MFRETSTVNILKIQTLNIAMITLNLNKTAFHLTKSNVVQRMQNEYRDQIWFFMH